MNRFEKSKEVYNQLFGQLQKNEKIQSLWIF